MFGTLNPKPIVLLFGFVRHPIVLYEPQSLKAHMGDGRKFRRLKHVSHRSEVLEIRRLVCKARCFPPDHEISIFVFERKYVENRNPRRDSSAV